MTKASLVIRVSDPWQFETQNGTGELVGEAEAQDAAAPGWEVRLSQRFRLDDHSFDQVFISARHKGDALGKLFGGLATVPVNIAYPEPHAANIANGRKWRLGMIGSVELRSKAD